MFTFSDMQLSRFPWETPSLEALSYLPHDFKNFVETLDFLDMHTKIFKRHITDKNCILKPSKFL